MEIEGQADRINWSHGIGVASKKAKKIDRRLKKAGRRIANCHVKRCYRTQIDAQITADLYNFEILVLSPMNPYYCPIHDTWHIGHNNKLNDAEARDYLLQSFDRAKKWLSCGIGGYEILSISGVN